MVISLVCSTLGNQIVFLKRFLTSIVEQNINENIEIVIIDQSELGIVSTVYEEYATKTKLIYLRDSKRGLSCGRNLGLQHATGDIIAFPDDDCWYNKSFFEQLLVICKDKYSDIVATSIADPNFDKNPYLRAGTRISGIVIVSDIFMYPSITLFFKRCIIENVKCQDGYVFDESMGAGSYFGSGEETDLLIRCLNQGAQIYACSVLTVFHPFNLDFEYGKDKQRSYARGLGALTKKHYNVKCVRQEYRQVILHSIGGTIIRGIRYKGAFKYYMYRLLGLIEGYYLWDLNKRKTK